MRIIQKVVYLAVLACCASVPDRTVAEETLQGMSAQRVLDATSVPGMGYGYRFEQFLQQYEAANTAFVNGDPASWLEIAADKEPVSIFGGFGGLGEAGVADVRQRYELAATAFRPSGAKVEFEYLVKDVRGRLAYTVAIERANVLYAGQTETKPQVLRVTMIFRFDKGGWKIVHRHADFMIDLQLPR
jgi:ketosteroid isomerase-like protein